MLFVFFFSQEHQDSILGNTMQTLIALLNNMVASKSTTMLLLFEEGMASFPSVILRITDVLLSLVISGSV